MSEESSEFDQQIERKNNEMQDEREERYGEERRVLNKEKRIMALGLTNEKLKRISNLFSEANREQLESIKEDIEKRVERLIK